jgi:hypothetical protein
VWKQQSGLNKKLLVPPHIILTQQLFSFNLFENIYIWGGVLPTLKNYRISALPPHESTDQPHHLDVIYYHA